MWVTGSEASLLSCGGADRLWGKSPLETLSVIVDRQIALESSELSEHLENKSTIPHKVSEDTMNRNKMLMGVKVDEPKVFINTNKVLKESRSVMASSLHLSGMRENSITSIIEAFEYLEKEEKKAGHFNVKISLSTYENEESEIDIFYERYETDRDVAKREEERLKKEAKKKTLEQKIKDPKYQQSLIDKMNKNVASTFKF